MIFRFKIGIKRQTFHNVSRANGSIIVPAGLGGAEVCLRNCLSDWATLQRAIFFCSLPDPKGATTGNTKDSNTNINTRSVEYCISFFPGNPRRNCRWRNTDRCQLSSVRWAPPRPPLKKTRTRTTEVIGAGYGKNRHNEQAGPIGMSKRCACPNIPGLQQLRTFRCTLKQRQSWKKIKPRRGCRLDSLLLLSFKVRIYVSASGIRHRKDLFQTKDLWTRRWTGREKPQNSATRVRMPMESGRNKGSAHVREGNTMRPTPKSPKRYAWRDPTTLDKRGRVSMSKGRAPSVDRHNQTWQNNQTNNSPWGKSEAPSNRKPTNWNTPKQSNRLREKSS